jgi:WD40 repeat protein
LPVHAVEVAAAAQLKATLKGHQDGIWQVAWAPDGQTLATVSRQSGELKLWDVAARKERATLGSDLGESGGLAFAPDGKTLLTGHYKRDGKGGMTGGISLWDVATGHRKALIQHTPPRGVVRLALAPDGKRIAALEYWREAEKRPYKQGVTLWDVESGKARVTLPEETVTDLAFSPDCKVLARAGYLIKDNQVIASEIRSYDLAHQRDLPALPNTASKSPAYGLVFSPDGRALAGADNEGNIVVWDAASATVRTSAKQGDGRRIWSLAFSPDGKTLAAAVGNHRGRDHEPGVIVLWDAVTGQRRLELAGHTNEVTSVAFAPDGKLLASGGSDCTVRLWDVTAPLATVSARSDER